MVRFNGVGFFGFCACGFNHIRINCALSQPFGVSEFFLFSIKDFNKFRADDFAFLFGVGNACQFRHKLLACIHVNDLHAQIVGEHLHDVIRFVQAQ